MANFTSNNDEGKDVETTEEQPALTKKWWHSLQANIIEGFHIDLAKRPSIKDLVDSYIQAMEMDNNESDDGSGEMEIELRLDCLWGDGKTLIPGVSVTSSRIKAMYSSSDDKDDLYSDKVVCVLKLCLAEIACGETVVNVEEHFRRVSIALKLDDTPQVSITNKLLTAQFGKGPVGYTKNAKAASLVVDNIMEEDDPYGWFIADFGSLALQCVGCITQFYGTWEDMAIVAACSFIWLVVRRLVIRRYNLIFGSIEVLVVAFITGAVTSFIWRYIYAVKELFMCHIFTIFLSSMYVYFPGSEIVFGAYEVYVGNFIHGSSRLIGALIRLMYMSFGLLIGWQCFGRGLLVYEEDFGEIGNSLIMGSSCPAFSADVFNIEPWWLVAFVFTLILTPLALIEFKVRPRDMLIPGITTYVTLVLNEVLNHGCDFGTCTQLPSYINNCIILFVGANVAYVFGYFYSYPAVNSLSSVILVFAPGASTMVRILNQMGREHGITNESVITTTSDLFANVGMVGVSYALGIILASSYWSVIMSRKDMKGNGSMQKKRVYFSYRGQQY